jgi:hypothetical protein
MTILAVWCGVVWCGVRERSVREVSREGDRDGWVDQMSVRVATRSVRSVSDRTVAMAMERAMGVARKDEERRRCTHVAYCVALPVRVKEASSW